MFVIIVDNNEIVSINLDKQHIYKGIYIYLKNNDYYITLKDGLYFIDKSRYKKLEYQEYTICEDKVYYNIKLYVYKDSSGFDSYNIYKNCNFVIANSEKANIICNDIYLKDYYLSCKDGILKSNCEVLVNHKKYDGYYLEDGDLIEYLGIRIIYYRDFLYINSFNLNIKLDKYKCDYSKIRYEDIKQSDNYFIPEDIYELQIEKIDDYKVPTKPNNYDFVRSLIPNFIMCLSMSFMAYMNYSSNHLNSNVSVYSYIIMPIAMMMTSIIVPSIFIIISNVSFDRKAKVQKLSYMDYLNRYKSTLQENIDLYINSINKRYFNLINSKNMMFYAKRKSDDYLKLSIGKINIKKDIELPKTEDNEINEKLNEIKNICNNIDNFPLYLNLKENKIVTFVSKSVDKDYFFYRYILEVAFKHHFDDVAIGVYACDSYKFDSIYNLPHLFYKGYRLTITNVQGLQRIDQEAIDKPLILFLYDKCNYTFTNPNIHVLYFTNRKQDIYKDSDAIVEFNNNTGYLYADRKTEFKHIQENIEFNKYFNYLGRYKSINSDIFSYNYKDIFGNEIKYDDTNLHSLTASFAYNEQNILEFDLHESKQGPHGLIGGSTGSGKSELIISMLLSLCIRYSPEYLNIVLIDYKGGGIKESLSYMNSTIPHIVASVSNLTNNTLQRLIIALNNECKRRQVLFKALSKYTNVSIMNLDDYLDNYDSKFSLNRIAHLLIVVDEFAELKKENPEQIKELISISRIGRSLGVHLILATQKPAGVIDDEIWSNSRFKIALKVFDEKDSSDIIKSKDAAYLSKPGSFYLQVDGGLIKAQSIYAKSDINGLDPYKVSILDSSLQVIKTYKKQLKQIYPVSDYYCKKIIEKCNFNKYNVSNIDFMPPVPLERYKLTSSKCLAFGEIDDYINNKKDLLAYDLIESLFIYSTRKYEVNSILNAFNEFDRKCVVIANALYCGKSILDSITYDDHEDIEYLFKYLLNNHNHNLTLIIEDISCLLSYDETYLDALTKLIKRKDTLKLSIICISTSNQISYKLVNSFKTKILINILENNDLSYFYGVRSRYNGNSFYYNGEPISFIPIVLEKYKQSKPIYPSIIKRIPEILIPERNADRYLIGYDIETKEKVYAEKFMALSFDSNLLDIYTRNYPDINACLYNYNLKVNDDCNILWLGKGVFNQRLFITNLKDDLKDNEGLYIENNRKTIIRRLNNA